MATPPDAPDPKSGPGRAGLLALIPVLALTLAIPLVNHLNPRIFGLPFLLAWILLWILLTPAFLALIDWLAHRGR